MATKSILKSVTIKDKATGRSLVSALEHADQKSEKTVTFSRTVRTADRQFIQRMFGHEDKK